MKLQFNPGLQYQEDAIKAITAIFKGQPLTSPRKLEKTRKGECIVSRYFGNTPLYLDENTLLDNLHAIQVSNGIEKIKKLSGRQFSIEMETGTGKTYVYLRTIFELNKQYGWTKFIIVVPNVAIREGVLASAKTMDEHFKCLEEYKDTYHSGWMPFIYDSKKRGDLDDYANSNKLRIMIINSQAFKSDKNIINIDKERDDAFIEYIHAMSPIVIVDEPQSVYTDLTKDAIANGFNPLFTLLYSATHREQYNMAYRLDPVEARRLELVKSVEIMSVIAKNDYGNSYINFLDVTNKKDGVRAHIEIHARTRDGIRPKRFWVGKNDNLYDVNMSNEYDVYKNNYIIEDINLDADDNCDITAASITFRNGNVLELGQITNKTVSDDYIMQAQIMATVREHLAKERQIRESGLKVKVLSLFFIDEVSNYRACQDNAEPKIKQWFEECYKKLTGDDADDVHAGYFAQDKKKRWVDTCAKSKEGRKQLDDAYVLIMKDKERLLDSKTPLRFIFSHTTLREGWDNPNVFQVCVLRDVKSEIARRQQIGRGLRLPVNSNGERVRDSNINRLTVIANEPYNDFAKNLQKEYRDAGMSFGLKEIAFAPLVGSQESSREIWQELRNNEYITDTGELTERFNPQSTSFGHALNEKLCSIADDIESDKLIEGIINIMKESVYSSLVPPNKNDELETKTNTECVESPLYKELCSRLNKKTRYKVNVSNMAKLTKDIAHAIKLHKFERPGIIVERGRLDAKHEIVEESHLETLEVPCAPLVSDGLRQVCSDTGITIQTLLKLIKSSNKLEDYLSNSQGFISTLTNEIHDKLATPLIEGVRYQLVKLRSWDAANLFKKTSKIDVGKLLQDKTYKSGIYEVKKRHKSPVNYIPCQSGCESKFARDCDNRNEVALFLKLPNKFFVDIPVAKDGYNPDWALIVRCEARTELYLVAETKGTTDRTQLRITEQRKIDCGTRHFAEIGDVQYQVVTDLNEVLSKHAQ